VAESDGFGNWDWVGDEETIREKSSSLEEVSEEEASVIEEASFGNWTFVGGDQDASISEEPQSSLEDENVIITNGEEMEWTYGSWLAE